MHVDLRAEERFGCEQGEVRHPADREGQHQTGEGDGRFRVRHYLTLSLVVVAQHAFRRAADTEFVDLVHLFLGDEQNLHVHATHGDERGEVSRDGHKQHVSFVEFEHA